jgi:hypothetical protein
VGSSRTSRKQRKPDDRRLGSRDREPESDARATPKETTVNNIQLNSPGTEMPFTISVCSCPTMNDCPIHGDDDE